MSRQSKHFPKVYFAKNIIYRYLLIITLNIKMDKSGKTNNKLNIHFMLYIKKSIKNISCIKLLCNIKIKILTAMNHNKNVIIMLLLLLCI